MYKYIHLWKRRAESCIFILPPPQPLSLHLPPLISWNPLKHQYKTQRLMEFYVKTSDLDQPNYTFSISVVMFLGFMMYKN